MIRCNNTGCNIKNLCQRFDPEPNIHAVTFSRAENGDCDMWIMHKGLEPVNENLRRRHPQFNPQTKRIRRKGGYWDA